ncbi:unnamed protein product, partial [Sphacelaria rigidula]
QIVIDCASPGSPMNPNDLQLRERAARALCLICLSAGESAIASPSVMSGLLSLLRCREGEVVGGAATTAVWALCRAPENRKAFAKMRVVACLMPLCEWSVESGYQNLHIYCLATLYLLSQQEPENASQVSTFPGGIVKLVAWAKPTYQRGGVHPCHGNKAVLELSKADNARAACCLGVVRRCLIQPEGFEAVAAGFASYSLLKLTLRLLRVGEWTKTVSSLALREAQGVLFALQDRAEYRGYCERICGNNPFAVEDTLALQLDRPSNVYDKVADDAIVGLASLSVTLASRRRLACNGTLESVTRLLGRVMAASADSCGGHEEGERGSDAAESGAGRRETKRNVIKLLKNLSTVTEAHGRLSSKPLLSLVLRLWEESVDEATSRLACHVLANVCRSPAPGVRNRLFRAHLNSESASLLRAIAASGDARSASVKTQQESHTSVSVSDPEASLSSSVFEKRSDTRKSSSQNMTDGGCIPATAAIAPVRLGGGYEGGGGTSPATANYDSSHPNAFRAARLDAQHRLRLTPAALWKARAVLAEAGVRSPPTSAPQATTHLQQRSNIAIPEAKQHGTTGKRHARKGATKGETYPSIPAGVSIAGESTCSAIDDMGISGGSAGGKMRGDGTECIQSASLKKHAVTDSVPLRWQSRMVALSCLRDHGNRGGGKTARTAARVTTATRTSRGRAPSKRKEVSDKGGEVAGERGNNNLSHTKRRSGQTKSTTTEDNSHQGERGHEERYGSESERSRVGVGEGAWSRYIPGDLGVPSVTVAGRHSSGLRPSTAPTHTDGKVVMRRLGSGSHDPPSIVFDPTYSPLKTRRIILDRIYRFTRYPDEALEGVGVNVNSNHGSDHENGDKGDGDKAGGKDDGDRQAGPLPNISDPDPRQRRPATALGLTRSEQVPGAPDGASGGDNTCRPADTGVYPNSLQSWRPPLLFQYCKASGGGEGERSTKENIILEPTSLVTHFRATEIPPTTAAATARGIATTKALWGRPAAPDDENLDVGGHAMRLDRFRHVPGCRVCQGSLGHVKVWKK